MKYSFLIAGLLLSLSIFAGEQPLLAGKMYFSNQLFTTSSAGSKKSFTSNENIYGRLELEGSTLKEAFKMKDPGNLPAYVMCNVAIFKNGEEIGSNNRNYLLVKEDETGNSWLNFDIMPDPSGATTVYSMLDDFSAGIGFGPLAGLIINETLEEGKYTVRIKIYNETKDGWGKDQPQEKWPSIEEEFEFNFRDADIARVNDNYKKASETIKENAFRYDKLPAIFANSANITDPKATPAKILAIIKRDLPQRTILKVGIEKTGTIWSIAKDDYGLPTYRYFYPAVYVAYKMNGKCYVGSVTLRETYEGGGRYGPLQVGFTSASTQPDKGIDCVKVK